MPSPQALRLAPLFALALAACSTAGSGVDDTPVEGEEGAAGTSAAGSGGAAAAGKSGASSVAGNAAGGSAGAAGASAGNAAGGSAGAGGGAAGASGGSAGASGGVAGGAGGKAGGACDDDGPEPNDSEALASPACGAPCEIGDKDTDGSAAYGGSHKSISGTAVPGDTDYFVFHGKDALGNQVDPSAKTGQSGFRLCVFTSCSTGTTDSFKCTAGTQVTSPGGLDGCCATAPAEVRSDHDCKGSLTDDDSAEVLIRIDQANACVDYLVDFHF